MAPASRRELPAGGTVEYEPSFLEVGPAETLRTALVRDLTWEAREIVIFGRRILQPRLIAWAGNVGYRYSGQTLEPREAPPALGDVLLRVVNRTGVLFNHVLVNRYRDGRDSMGFHADDEAELGPSPTVASLSLGAPRRFVLVPRRGKEPRIEYPLEHGSLLVMSGACQANYHHGIPKELSIENERLSLTFRQVRTGALLRAGASSDR